LLIYLKERDRVMDDDASIDYGFAIIQNLPQYEMQVVLITQLEKTKENPFGRFTQIRGRR
jgi:hypothetical protein